MARMRVGIIGNRGFLGAGLAEHFGKFAEVDGIDKDSYAARRGRSYDVLVNANGNSRRFWANEHPLEDFAASTITVAESFADFSAELYVYISSSDVYENHSSPATTRESQVAEGRNLSAYGFHKFLSEQIVRQRAKEFLILRLSAMVGEKLQKGPVFDILHGHPLYVTSDSRIQFIATREVARVAEFLIQSGKRNGTFNVGGRGAVEISRLGEFIATPLRIAPEAKKQEYEMNVERLLALFPLKTSEAYLKEFLQEYHA